MLIVVDVKILLKIDTATTRYLKQGLSLTDVQTTLRKLSPVRITIGEMYIDDEC